VAERNGTTSGIDVIGTETEDLGVGLDDGRKGFVEFPDGNVRLGESGLGEELFYACGGGDGEVDGIWGCFGVVSEKNKKKNKSCNYVVIVKDGKRGGGEGEREDDVPRAASA
jgi:hypothetical protein